MHWKGKPGAWGWEGATERFKHHSGLTSTLPVYHCIHRERRENVFKKSTFEELQKTKSSALCTLSFPCLFHLLSLSSLLFLLCLLSLSLWAKPSNPHTSGLKPPLPWVPHYRHNTRIGARRCQWNSEMLPFLSCSKVNLRLERGCGKGEGGENRGEQFPCRSNVCSLLPRLE